MKVYTSKQKQKAHELYKKACYDFKAKPVGMGEKCTIYIGIMKRLKYATMRVYTVHGDDLEEATRMMLLISANVCRNA